MIKGHAGGRAPGVELVRLKIFGWLCGYFIMAKARSQGAGGAKASENEGNAPKRRTDDRQRVYAFLAYEDSSYPDWMERLDQEHIAALVSPYHDKDINPDGTEKKPHWHIMLMFEGKKSIAQINEIRERVLGPNYNKKFEEIGSMRGYARYLCHFDNPEKAQYDRAEVRAFAGADYDAIILLPSDDIKMLGDIMDYIRANKVRYFSDFMIMCRDNNPDWFSMLVTRKSYVIIEFIKSEAARAKQEEIEMQNKLRKQGVVFGCLDPKTGEFQEVNYDS